MNRWPSNPDPDEGFIGFSNQASGGAMAAGGAESRHDLALLSIIGFENDPQ